MAVVEIRGSDQILLPFRSRINVAFESHSLSTFKSTNKKVSRNSDLKTVPRCNLCNTWCVYLWIHLAIIPGGILLVQVGVSTVPRGILPVTVFSEAKSFTGLDPHVAPKVQEISPVLYPCIPSCLSKVRRL